ncbi:MAG: GIY-YIG nuclease family protein [Candidatus Kerfeldbacteria bacterium]|nr:GIY-YIG nuclease family protein [Candidatus Kerfeldbacteria bacterium]
MPTEKQYYVYIMTNKTNSVLYIGTTRNLEGRVRQHKSKEILGFAKKYNVNKLVYYEEFFMATDAFAREKQLKNWHRDWKLNLVRAMNQHFNDLSVEWYV